jgi:hypothetical protein
MLPMHARGCHRLLAAHRQSMPVHPSATSSASSLRCTRSSLYVWSSVEVPLNCTLHQVGLPPHRRLHRLRTSLPLHCTSSGNVDL